MRSAGGATARSEDDQLCTVSESPVSASRRRWSVPTVHSAETVVSELPMHPRVSRAVQEAGARLGGCRDARTLSGRGGARSCDCR